MVPIIVVGVVVLVLVWGVAVYNRLVTWKNRFLNAFSQIDVQLKRRHDLIPNLVETAKGYLTHERETLEAVTRARTDASGALKKAATDPADTMAVLASAAAEQLLGGALGRFFMLREAYPDLKASETMSLLFEELTGTENRIAFARQAYNDTVMRYNTAMQVFPASLVAGLLGFRTAALYELEDDAERAVPSARVHGDA